MALLPGLYIESDELFKITEHLFISFIYSLYGATGRFVSGVS